MKHAAIQRIGFAAILLTAGFLGCSGGNAPQPVSGKVTIKGGGPLEKGTVRFTNAATRTSGSGDLDPTGSFQISSLGTNDGVPPGEYTVTFSGTEHGGGYSASGDSPAPKKVIDDKYEADSTTDQKFTVKPGKNVANFELEPAK